MSVFVSTTALCLGPSRATVSSPCPQSLVRRIVVVVAQQLITLFRCEKLFHFSQSCLRLGGRLANTLQHWAIRVHDYQLNRSRSHLESLDLPAQKALFSYFLARLRLHWSVTGHYSLITMTPPTLGQENSLTARGSAAHPK